MPLLHSPPHHHSRLPKPLQHHQCHSNSPPLLCPSPIRSCKASSLLRPLSNVATGRTPVHSAAPITATTLFGNCAHHHNTKPIHLGNHFNSIQSSPYLKFTITIQQAIKQLTQSAISWPTINQIHNQSPKLRYTSLSRYVSTVQSSPAQLAKVASLSQAKHMAVFVSKNILITVNFFDSITYRAVCSISGDGELYRFHLLPPRRGGEDLTPPNQNKRSRVNDLLFNKNMAAQITDAESADLIPSPPLESDNYAARLLNPLSHYGKAVLEDFEITKEDYTIAPGSPDFPSFDPAKPTNVVMIHHHRALAGNEGRKTQAIWVTIVARGER
ncbi:hypothetical protein M0R45_006201 [Rubus argutus]|uniref:Uncharacterized protein n=1 Tax=Rubus argutus TaxID=59490 RepID=A0AAW1YQ43_RUBAR